MSKADIKIVRKHNAWRRGGKGKMADPKRLGEALDSVVAMAAQCETLESAIRQTLADNGHLADGENCTLILLKRAIGIEQCKKCGADMQDGIAIAQTLSGSLDMGEVCTMSPGGSGKLIDCRKCPECGWSVTA